MTLRSSRLHVTVRVGIGLVLAGVVTAVALWSLTPTTNVRSIKRG